MNNSAPSDLSDSPFPTSQPKADGVLIALLILALGAGAFLRLLFPSDVEFKADELLGLLVGVEWLQSPCIATHGMVSSVGIPNPPITVYLFATLYGLSKGDPEVATMLVAVWNLVGLALGGLWLYAKRETFGRLWSFWILAFVCVNPWTVIYSRKIWAPSLLAPFVIGAIAGLSTIWSERWDWKKVVGGLLCFSIASQIHMSGIFWSIGLAVGILVVWPSNRRAKLPLFLIIASAIFLLLYVPWMMHLFERSIGTPIHAGESIETRAIRTLCRFIPVWFGLVWPEVSFYFAPDEAKDFFNELGIVWKILQIVATTIAGGVFFFALVRLTIDTARRKSSQILNAFPIAMVVFLVLPILSRSPVNRYYGAIFIWPAALICGFGWREVEKFFQKGRWGRRPLLVAAALVLVGCVWSASGFLIQIHRAAGARGEYGPALRVSREEVLRVPPGIALNRSALSEIRYLFDLMNHIPIVPAAYSNRFAPSPLISSDEATTSGYGPSQAGNP